MESISTDYNRNPVKKPGTLRELTKAACAAIMYFGDRINYSLNPDPNASPPQKPPKTRVNLLD